MKKFLFLNLLPLLFCISGVFIFHKNIDRLLFSDPISPVVDNTFRHIGNFAVYPGYEDLFLSTGDSSENIWMIGSSELGVNTIATPYNFINDNFKTHLKAIGHEGNQSFSVYSMLLSNASKLENTPIIILVSPGWFHSKSVAGTSATVFLEFNPTSFLDNIMFNDSDKSFRQYEAKRISGLFDEFSNPNLAMKTLYFEDYSGRNLLSRIISFPLTLYYSAMLSLKKDQITEAGKNKQKVSRNPVFTEDNNINWDSLYKVSSAELIKNSRNNHWGIDSGYYNEYIKGSTSTIKMVCGQDNRELEDFCMLVRLLKEKKANASFVIQPINPFYYKNAPELNSLIWKLNTEIKLNGFPCLNLWNADSATFDKNLLKDVMHLSSYGWYKIDKFIIDTYKLTR